MGELFTTELTLGTVERAFSQWSIWAGEYCYTAECRPTSTARWFCVSTTLAGLVAKLRAEMQESG
jgi:hypothetical protein